MGEFRTIQPYNSNKCPFWRTNLTWYDFGKICWSKKKSKAETTANVYQFTNVKTSINNFSSLQTLVRNNVDVFKDEVYFAMCYSCSLSRF